MTNMIKRFEQYILETHAADSDTVGNGTGVQTLTFRAKLTYLKDRIGNSYVGIHYPASVLASLLEIWEESIGFDPEEYIANQQNRDGGKHHTTVVNVPDYQRLDPSVVERYIGQEVELTFVGVGSAEARGNQTHFIVVESEELQQVRRDLGLEPFDFHITIGFKDKDCFGVSKGRDALYLHF
jgi:hypothetical protein